MSTLQSVILNMSTNDKKSSRLDIETNNVIQEIELPWKKKKKWCEMIGALNCHLYNAKIRQELNKCSWPASFQSGSLTGYLCFNETVSVLDCTESITTQHSIRPKLPAVFALFETNNEPSVRVLVSEIFVALILDFLIYLKVVRSWHAYWFSVVFVSEEDDLPFDETVFSVTSLES